jgi:competence protein ComEC
VRRILHVKCAAGLFDAEPNPQWKPFIGSHRELARAAVRPSLALLSAGRDNRFGFPKPIVLRRYQRYGVRLLDSAGHGSLWLRLGPAGVELRERFRQDRPRYWRHAGGGYAIGGPPEPDR